MPVFCSDCKTEFDPKSAEANGQPCPTCGSIARDTILEIPSIKLRLKFAAPDVVITYRYEVLLALARTLINEGRHDVSIMVSHIACEVCTELALSRAFAALNVANLEEPVEKMMNGYNLANNRHRDLYNALTGRTIQSESFWSAFTASSNRRNAIMHKGAAATLGEAEQTHKAATDLVAYLK